LLIKEEIGALHRAMASNYDDIITSRAREAIKNEAIDVKFSEYIRNRTDVEERFRQAVDRSWGKPPRLPCELDQFHLGRVQIDESGEALLMPNFFRNYDWMITYTPSIWSVKKHCEQPKQRLPWFAPRLGQKPDVL
jgi:hypothetical protein